jgi:5-methyltetrahydrofolate--homocysteine methyltransferase
MGSTGKMLKPYGPLPEEEARQSFVEQARILAEEGVDGFIIETMFDVREAVAAVRACAQAADLPVIASIAFNTLNNGGRTIMGNSARDCARSHTDAGASAVGTNCGNLDPFQMAEIVSRMREAPPCPSPSRPTRADLCL